MAKGQKTGVEQQFSRQFSPAVEPVADNGHAQSQGMGGVQTQLMGASGEGYELHPAPFSFDAKEPPAADAHFPMHRVMDLIGPVVRVKAEGQADLA